MVGLKQQIQIALLSGSFPPDMCGVGDYSYTLAQELKSVGVLLTPIIERNWSVFKLGSILARIKDSGAKLLHVQYPSLSYHASLVPHLLPMFLSIPTIVTLHEFKYAHPLRKFAAFLFGFKASKIIFPNKEDMASFKGWYPWFAHKCKLIELGSNIPVILGKFIRESEEVIYFGMIRPQKGIENFLEAVNSCREGGGSYRFGLIGGLDANNPEYSQSIIEQAQKMGVVVSVNLSSEKISELLQKAKYAYLPFPGGPSERRTSLLAVIEHGCIVLTGKASGPSEFSKVVIEVSKPSELNKVLKILDDDENLLLEKQKVSKQLIEQYNWPKIAQKHIDLFRAILET